MLIVFSVLPINTSMYICDDWNHVSEEGLVSKPLRITWSIMIYYIYTDIKIYGKLLWHSIRNIICNYLKERKRPPYLLNYKYLEWFKNYEDKNNDPKKADQNTCSTIFNQIKNTIFLCPNMNMLKYLYVIVHYLSYIWDCESNFCVNHGLARSSFCLNPPPPRRKWPRD